MKKIITDFIPNSLDYKAPVLDLLTRANPDFFPPLSKRVDLDEYAEKLLNSAFIIASYFESEEKQRLLGMYAGYAHDGYDYAYGSFMWVDKDFREYALGFFLQKKALAYVKERKMKGIKAHTWTDNNDNVITFYKRLGYEISKETFNSELNRHEVIITYTFK